MSETQTPAPVVNGLIDTRIQIHEDYHLIPWDEQCLIILGEQQRYLLRDPAMITVMLSAADRSQRSQIVQHCSATLDMFQCEMLIDQLIARGYLIEQWPDERSATTQPPAVTLHTQGIAEHASLEQLLASQGISSTHDASLQLLVVTDYLQLTPQWIAAQTDNGNQPALILKPTGKQPLIGPLLQPGKGPCPACLQFWIRQNRPVETMLARSPSRTPVLPPASPTISAVACSLAGDWVRRYLANDKTLQHDQILSLDGHNQTLQHHPLQQRPQCPQCGAADWMQQQTAQPPSLSADLPRESREGGYRLTSPDTTWQRYKHLISPVCGAISYLHTMPDRHREDRPVFAAGYLVSPQQMPANNSFDKLCAGKGRTIAQARTSALCEALERFSGVYQGDESQLSGSLTELPGPAITFNQLQNFSNQQFNQREQINACTEDRRRQVPERLTADTRINWTPAWSLQDLSQHWVPLNYCYAEAPDSSQHWYGIHNPNGVAAGNCMEEAIIQGFLELVERDATAIWWYNCVPRPSVPTTHLDTPFVSRLRQQYQEQGWALWLLDLTTDLGIPVCAALAHNPDTQRFAIGFGCHFDWPLAIERALTELNQLHDLTGKAPNPWDHQALPAQQFLFPDHQASATEPLIYAGTTLSELITSIATHLDQQGMKLLMVNKTRPDIGLPVVQIIVPGLRHFWPRLGEGRLYDVPVALGWLESPRSESQLNPVPLFL